MNETQYIGSRYVPIFADPIEHSSAKEYEPLTIVLYDGASYTSKQYVPVGIEITDTRYWALTGNYNAQVEQYSREVLEYTDLVNFLNEEKNYKTLVCPDDFEGADDTAKIINALTYAHEHNLGVGFKCRQYEVNSSLPLYRNAKIYGNGATIRAVGSFSLFKTQEDYSSNAIISDLFLTGSVSRTDESICIDFEGYSCSFLNLDIRNFYWAVYQRNDIADRSNQTGNYYVNIKVRNCENSFYFGANDNARNTDGYMSNIVACGNRQLYIGSAAGWFVENFHSVEGALNEARTNAPIILHSCSATELNNIYIEPANWSAYSSTNCMISAHVAKDCSINNVKIVASDTCAGAIRFSSTVTAQNQTLNVSNLFADNPARNSENAFAVILLEHRLNRNVYISNINFNIPNGSMTSDADKSYLSVVKYGGFASIDKNVAKLFENTIPNVLTETKAAAGNLTFSIPATPYNNRNFIVFGNSRHLAQSDSPIARCFVIGSFYHTTNRQDVVCNSVSSDNVTVSAEYDSDAQEIIVTIVFTSDDANQRGQFSCVWC